MAEQALIREDIEAYLARRERKTLLRFVIVGSVDDGKSTLIGRLLYDTGNVYDDQLAAIRTASKLEDGSIDLSLLTDGLAAEREQGITIDVAYRYFTTDSRKFIVADTPGHVQYTRNMVTGASTADVAIILIDARLGVLDQSRRHSYIASLLGIPHLLVAVNKMDLRDYSQRVFEDIQRDFGAFAKRLHFNGVAFVPVSAYKGDNVAEASPRMPWYTGKTVLRFLEEVPVEAGLGRGPFRYPVQYVNRPNLHYRGFCGQVASGVVKKGDTIMVLPSGITSKVKAIDTAEGEVDEAFAPLSVTLRLHDEVDCSRGDMIVHPGERPDVARRFDADLVWMHERPLDTQKTYLIKHTTQAVRVQVEQIKTKVDLATLVERPFGAGGALELNDIARVTLTCHRALYVDAYAKNRATGAFILVDSLYNTTVAAGMILPIAGTEEPQSLDGALEEIPTGSGLQPTTQVSPGERRERFGHTGATVWLTGISGSGRWSLAYALERRLFDLGRTAHVIAIGRRALQDPSDFRGAETLDAITAAAQACTDAGLFAICAFPSYKRRDRERVRAAVGDERFVEVYVNTSLALCRERRPDASFEGFEAPERPALEVALDGPEAHGAVEAIVDLLQQLGQFGTT